MTVSRKSRKLLLALAISPWLSAAHPALAQDGASAASPAANGAVMVDARIVGDEQRTRFVADLSDVVEIALFTLSDPYRIIVDLPQTSFGLPETVGGEGRGLLSAFRYGEISPGKSRLVLDLAGPVTVDKSFVVPAADGQPARLVIDVVPATRDEFLAAARQYRDAQAASAEERKNRELVPHPGGSGRIRVVLDPGHGGIDTGAKGVNGAIEKTINLEFAKLLGVKLEETGLYEVHYTRTDDRFVALGERVAMARSIEARLFISIHANSFSSRSVRGTVIYTVSDQASDRMAAEIAANENRSDILAGIEIEDDDPDGVVDILIDLTRRETRNFGVVFARNLIGELRKEVGMFKVPHQTAGFKVLEAPDVPSAMIELGYLSNPEDERQLISPEWREKAADSIVKAVANYFAGRTMQKAEN